MTYRCALSFGREASYGTQVTTGRAKHFITEGFDIPDLDVESEAYVPGSDVASLSGVTRPTKTAIGAMEYQPTTRGEGRMFETLMGAGLSALVSGTTYQQVFTFADVMPSETVQKQLPRRDQSIGTQTYRGVVNTGFEIKMDAKGVLAISADFDAREGVIGQAADALVTVMGERFVFAGAYFYSTLTSAPTSTALAVLANPVAGVRSWSVKVDHKLDTDATYTGNNAGLKDRPMPSDLREITMNASIEYQDDTFETAYLNGSALAFGARFQALSETLSTGVPTIDVILPCLRAKGPMPKADKGLIVTDRTFKAYNNGTSAQRMWIVTRTADSALS